VLYSLLNRFGSPTKDALRSLGHSLGLEVRLNGPSARDDLRLIKYLADGRIGLVLDVGANRGQFASGLFNNGYRGSIVSFEALPGVHAELRASAARHRGRWQVPDPVALCNEEGTRSFHCNVADATSSLLRVSGDALRTMPGAAPQSELVVRASRLDSVLRELGVDASGAFLKIDVQGAEDQVIAGAQETLGQVVGLVVEMSLQRLYEGQPLYHELLPVLRNRGFEVVDIWQGYRDPRSLRMLQMDVVLFRTPPA
jgi:FkbM family methyltransferase